MPPVTVRTIADFERNFATYDAADGQMKNLFPLAQDLVGLAIEENVPASVSKGD